MANTDYTYDGILNSGSGSFQKESPIVTSASVRRMQHKLIELGYLNDSADGRFGTNTYNAVVEFQTDYGLTPDGKAGKNTLAKLEELHPDTTIEHYGRELTKSELQAGKTNSAISATEALARIFYNEDQASTEGECAVAKEVKNRYDQNSTRNFTAGASLSWKNILYAKKQYFDTSEALYGACSPNQYSTNWFYCVRLATKLVEGSSLPATSLGNQCFHVGKSSSYPSSAVESTKIQIPVSSGNKFYDVISV